MTNFTQKDFNTGYKICPVCCERVFILEAGFEVEQEKCKRCDSCSVSKKDFFINDAAVEILGK